jgi:hypothetical protein
MPTFGDGDSMSVPFSWDQGGFYPYGSDGFRETWYIARDGAANRGPFYRHYSSSLGNHRDSPSPSESGYTLEGTLGYPWTADLGGMKPLRRLYNSSITDHRTWLFDPPLPPGYVVNATWWPGGASPRLGYQRFANLPDQCSAVAAGEAAGSVLQNSKLRVRFNKIWGNAIGELTHLASGQDLVSSSIGDMMQSVIFYGGPDSSH